VSVPGIRGGQLRSVVAEFKIAAWRAMLGDDAWSMFNDKWLAKAIARGAMIRAVAIAAVVRFARRELGLNRRRMDCHIRSTITASLHGDETGTRHGALRGKCLVFG